MLSLLRNKVVRATNSLFEHAPNPLEHTMEYRGDPGLFGPDSVTWPVIGNASAFVGAIRALLIQAAHPEVVAGVADHSRYQDDPLGRLSRTSAYVTAVSFGSMPEVEQAVAVVKKAHRPVAGRSHRDVAYTADTPEFAAWVHNALTDSFLGCYQAFSGQALRAQDADRFVMEQTKVGALLDAAPMPQSAAALSRWVTAHPALAPSPGMKDAVDFIANPPLPKRILLSYRVLYHAAVATLPERLRQILGVKAIYGGHLTGKVSVAALQFMLGSSPAWHAALLRVGAEVPKGTFTQSLPPGFHEDSPT